MCNNADILFPVLLLCDQEGKYVDFEEDDLVPELEKIDDSTVRYFKPTDDENTMFRKTYGNLVTEMLDELDRQTEPVREYNRRKIENWIRIQNEQLVVQYQEMNAEIEELRKEEKASNNFYEKIDIRKRRTRNRRSSSCSRLPSMSEAVASEQKARGKLPSSTEASRLTIPSF